MDDMNYKYDEISWLCDVIFWKMNFKKNDYTGLPPINSLHL